MRINVKPIDELPKSIKKTIRYINQDIKSLDDLEKLEKTLFLTIEKRKIQLDRLNK